MSDNILNRGGKFVIELPIIRENPYYIIRLLSEVLVIRAEDCFMKNAVTYFAYSDHFDVLNEGEEIPEYQAIVHGSDHLNGIKIEWKKL